MGIKIGLGLYPHLLKPENYRFARQIGVSHVVAHLPGYSRQVQRPVPPEQVWTYEELRDLKAELNAEGLVLAAIENFEPEHWYDVLLDGPRKHEQMAGLKTIVRNMGRAGVPVMGYNFSFAGVWGRVRGPWARGGAQSTGWIADQAPAQAPIPLGTVWGTVYDKDAPAGTLGQITQQQLWSRLEYFLRELLPVAEEANVKLALHPDDPPLPELRQTARLVYKPEIYQRVFDLVPSPMNTAEFCQGTVAEMDGEMDVYQAIDNYAAQGKIAYVHFRNVRGKVPNYYETFVDDGDVDMVRALRLYHRHGYDGVIIPDHTPGVECAAPWHAGMAYAVGWMRATLRLIEE